MFPPEIVTVAAAGVVTVIVTVFEVTVDEVTQAAFEANTQLTTSLFDKVVVVYVVLFVPTFPPLTFHWYTGVLPPLVGVAVKVTDVPVQIFVLLATILIEAVTEEVTVIVIGLELTVNGLAQAAEDVKSKVIISLFAKVVVVYEEVVAPLIGVPFFFQT